MEQTMSQSESLIKKPFTVDSKVVSELAFLFTIYILVTGLLILHFRAWEPDIVRQVLGISVYPTAFFGGVALVWPYITNVIWILPIACLVLMGLPFLTALLGAWSLLPLGIFGVTATLFAYRASHPKLLSKTLQLVLAGSILAVIFFCVCNSYRFAYIFSDISVYTNTAHRDTLFLTAVIQMLANFDISSAGLDGVNEFSYHILTFRWVAANFKILSGEAILLLAISQQLVFLPAFFFAASLTFNLLTSIELPALVTCGFSFLALLLGVASRTLHHLYLTSESYTFSLPIFMAMLPVGRSWLFQSCQSQRWLTVHPLAIATAVVVVLACGATKISSGVMLALFLILCVFIPKVWQKDSISWVNVGRLLVLAVVFALGCLMLGSSMAITSLGFHPLKFALGAPLKFIVLNFLLLGPITLLYFLRSGNGKSYQKSQILVLIVVALASQFPLNFSGSIESGSAYFINLTLMQVSFFTVAAVADHWYIHRNISLVVATDSMNHSRWRVFQKLISWGLLLITIAFSLRMFIIYTERVSGFINESIITLDKFSAQEQLPQLAGLNKTKHQFKLLLSPPNQTEKLNQDTRLVRNTELSAIQSHIRALNLFPDHPRPTVIYIAPSFIDFWHRQEWIECWAKPFVIPAMTGFPLLNGVSNKINSCPEGETEQNFTIPDYSSNSWNRSLSESDLCTKATRLGFAQVLSITDRSKYKLLTCPTQTASK